MTAEERISQFQAQLLCGNPVYLWHYGPERQVVNTSCPDHEIFHEAFCAFGCYDRAWKHLEEDAAPMMLGAPIGLEWAAVGDRLGDGPSQNPMRDRDMIYRGERAILRMVREGDLNYKWALNNGQSASGGIPVTGTDPLRQAKTSVIVFTPLCVREAIAGGMTPDQAYRLGDQYIQSVEDCSSIEQIGAYSSAMCADFIERVHKCRTNMGVSRQIRACCDYIELHAEDDLSMEALARQAGYSKYYLSRKFKEETGATVTEYIKAARMERAKLLLAATELSVQEISEKLHFCSRSYFSTVFLQTVGCTPTEYREKVENN